MRGRCSGCGYEDASSAKVRRHVAGCVEYAKLYREQPDQCLSPEAEAAQHAEKQASAEAEEARAAAKSEAVDRWREFQERRAEAERVRWAVASRPADGRGTPLSASEMGMLAGAVSGDQDVASAVALLERGQVSPRQRVVLSAFAGLM